SASPRGSGRNRFRMGGVGEQPARQVLLAHSPRARAAPRRSRDLAALRVGGRANSRGDVSPHDPSSDPRIPRGVRRALRLPSTRERLLRELDDEIRFHVEERVARLTATGMAVDEAYAEALRRFGDMDDLRRYCTTM